MKKIIYWLTTASVFLYATGSALATTVTINTNIPGLQGGPTIPNNINAFYKYAIYIGGILAFGAVVYGGVKYVFAAGNPSGQSEGKDWIKSALLGLALLAGAYLILNVINPNLINLNIPQPASVSVSNPGVATTTVVPCSSSNPYGYCQSGTCINGICGGPNAAGNSVYGCIAPNGYYACTNNTSNYSGSANPCSGTTCQGLTTQGCFLIANPSQTCTTSPGLSYACINSSGNYSCSPSYRSDCSDAANCSSNYGGGCQRISTSQCNTSSGSVPATQALSSGCETTAGTYMCVNTGNCATISNCSTGNFGCHNYSNATCNNAVGSGSVIQVRYACTGADANGNTVYICSNANSPSCGDTVCYQKTSCIQIQNSLCGTLVK